MLGAYTEEMRGLGTYLHDWPSTLCWEGTHVGTLPSHFTEQLTTSQILRIGLMERNLVINEYQRDEILQMVALSFLLNYYVTSY